MSWARHTSCHPGHRRCERPVARCVDVVAASAAGRRRRILRHGRRRPEAAPAAAPAAAAIGTPVRDGKLEFTVTSVEPGVPSVGSDAFGQKAQGQFVLMHLTIKNTGDKAQCFDGSPQKAFDAQGRAFSADSGAAIHLANSNSFLNEIKPATRSPGPSCATCRSTPRSPSSSSTTHRSPAEWTSRPDAQLCTGQVELGLMGRRTSYVAVAVGDVRLSGSGVDRHHQEGRRPGRRAPPRDQPDRLDALLSPRPRRPARQPPPVATGRALDRRRHDAHAGVLGVGTTVPV
ncbi:MAG: DUF4352 domain-containing protein [Cellulomonas sp.]